MVVRLLDHQDIRGYLNPSQLGQADPIELLTVEGSREVLEMNQIKCIYFVREFAENFEPERKAFLSRPKLDGLWVRLRFRDDDTIEGIVPNNLLELLDRGVQITPPDLHGECLRMFIPRTALLEMTALGLVGVARRKPVAVEVAQPRLFNE